MGKAYLFEEDHFYWNIGSQPGKLAGVVQEARAIGRDYSNEKSLPEASRAFAAASHLSVVTGFTTILQQRLVVEQESHTKDGSAMMVAF